MKVAKYNWIDRNLGILVLEIGLIAVILLQMEICPSEKIMKTKMLVAVNSCRWPKIGAG